MLGGFEPKEVRPKPAKQVEERGSAATAAASHSASECNRWMSIFPGTDTALAMALIRWMLENEAYAIDYLALPGNRAAQSAGEPGHTNATHLVSRMTTTPVLVISCA